MTGAGSICRSGDATVLTRRPWSLEVIRGELMTIIIVLALFLLRAIRFRIYYDYLVLLDGHCDKPWGYTKNYYSSGYHLICYSCGERKSSWFFNKRVALAKNKGERK